MPVGPYATFGACVAAQKRKGRSDESARKICGKIEQNERQARNANQQLPASLKAPLERSQKALKFLERNNALVDTSLDSPQSEAFTDMSTTTSNNVTTITDDESYSDKITRIMDEYGVDEQTAVQVVNRLIEEEHTELTRRQFEIQKQLEIEKAREEGREPPLAEEEEQPQQDNENAE